MTDSSRPEVPCHAPIEDPGSYEEAETLGRDRQETDGTPTLAQWARAEALKALLGNAGDRVAIERLSMPYIENKVYDLAQLIVTGSAPVGAKKSES